MIARAGSPCWMKRSNPAATTRSNTATSGPMARSTGSTWAREKAQEQLRQAQKMETIGQLTGGVAHDFNNLLMAVMGNLDLLRKRLPDDPRLRRLVDGALQGAERGASLTQRLLAFARQQDLRAVPVDLRVLIQGMIDLLERSLGPRIALRVDIPEGLPPARI